MLKSGGRLLIVDGLTGAYAKYLREQKMNDVEQRPLDWRYWLGIPWVVGLVTASKPPTRRA